VIIDMGARARVISKGRVISDMGRKGCPGRVISKGRVISDMGRKGYRGRG
jgi:hypothetical protein